MDPKERVRRRDLAIERVRKLVHLADEGRRTGKGSGAASYALNGKSTLVAIHISIDVARDLISEWPEED